jgi:hypothetical protein
MGEGMNYNEAITKEEETPMALDIKGKIDELVKKIKSDKDLAAKFQKDPIKTVEGLIGVDLPDGQVEKIVDGIKAKISLDKLGGKLGGLFGK